MRQICVEATEPVVESVVRCAEPVAESVVESIPVESSLIQNKLDTLTVHTRNNFDLFKVMYEAVRGISQTQNDLTVLLSEIAKQQQTIQDMLLENASKKIEPVLTNPLPALELKKSFSAQLLKPKKRIP